MGNSKLIDDINGSGKSVVIFGAAVCGELFLRDFKVSMPNIKAFCDNSVAKQTVDIGGIEVYKPSESVKLFGKCIFIVTVGDVKAIYDELKSYGAEEKNIYLLSQFYENVASEELDFGKDEGNYKKYVFDSCIVTQNYFLQKDKFYIRNIDLVITERCSLKCKDCCNLMQYYEYPKDRPFKAIVEDIMAVVSSCDMLNEIRLIGGEPFMNKDIYHIIRYIINNTKVNKIAIYTNGTILPDINEIELLKSNRIFFYMADYGDLSTYTTQIKELFDSNDINYKITLSEIWTDCASIAKHERSIQENQEIFKICCANRFFTVLNGEFHLCPFSANARNLKAIPCFDDDFINLHMKGDILEQGERLRKLLRETKYLQACDYCTGRPITGEIPLVPAAVQVKEPMAYFKHGGV